MVVYNFDKLEEIHKDGCPDCGQLQDGIGRLKFQKNSGSNFQVVKTGRVEEQIVEFSNRSREAVEHQWRLRV